MDMGIVNPTMLEIYDEVDRIYLPMWKILLLNRRERISQERLLEYAETVKAP